MDNQEILFQKCDPIVLPWNDPGPRTDNGHSHFCDIATFHLSRTFHGETDKSCSVFTNHTARFLSWIRYVGNSPGEALSSRAQSLGPGWESNQPPWNHWPHSPAAPGWVKGPAWSSFSLGKLVAAQLEDKAWLF